MLGAPIGESTGRAREEPAGDERGALGRPLRPDPLPGRGARPSGGSRRRARRTRSRTSCCCSSTRRSTPAAAARAAELPMGEDWYEMQGIEVCDTDRGGRVTYHGPGQLVGYPIVDLKPYGDDVHAYVRRLEQVMIEALGDHGVGAGVVDGLTGVWTAHGEAPPPAPPPRACTGGRRGPDPQDRLDRDPRQPRRHHPRPRDQRQQRPAAVRVDRPLRDRRLPDDLAGARARGASRTSTPSRPPSPSRFAEVYERAVRRSSWIRGAGRAGRGDRDAGGGAAPPGRYGRPR